MILQVALDTPLRRVFDYRAPESRTGENRSAPRSSPQPGVRVRVPFGRRQLVGILVGTTTESTIDSSKLRSAIDILDDAPVFDPVTFDLLRWAADYYHHPLGEVFAAALPADLRAGQGMTETTRIWRITPAGREALSHSRMRAPRQRALLSWLEARGAASRGQLEGSFTTGHLRTLVAKGWVVSEIVADSSAGSPCCDPPSPGSPAPQVGPAPQVSAAPQESPAPDTGLTLTAEQCRAVNAIVATRSSFAAHLLYGVTGSGKTEVYLRIIAEAIRAQGQALVLVPEIALTPQLVERFRSRFGGLVAVVHSGRSDAERRDAWRAAHSGSARIVIGTRSAVFTSMPALALIVVDEEHDASYKQQEGFRYSARDLGVMRARGAAVPIVLGSATPSLESIENAVSGRYVQHVLPQRPGGARPPRMSLIDLRRHATEAGISTPVLQAMAGHLKAGGQVIVFLNRRGYAPALFCSACGWVAPCEHCDARMTLHRRAGQLRCHHCGAQGPVPPICGACGQPLLPVGQGTERIEETLLRLFPDAPLARLDRDTAAARGALETVLDRVHRGEARILVGTQMLTKGHHFPDVSLVVVLDADQGLFASDFRATERLAQTITQVAGRAGRAQRIGEVMIQTQFPEHPLLNRLIAHGYESFASSALEERREAGWPPYSRLALLRAEAKDSDALDTFLRAAAAAGAADPTVTVLGPASALLARRADHFRAHVLVETVARATLQRFLRHWLPRVAALPGPRGLRWSIDVDPLEVD